MNVLTINCGSSSIKFAVYDMPGQIALASGKIENIGRSDSVNTYITYADKNSHGTKTHKSSSKVPDYNAGLESILEIVSNDKFLQKQNTDAIGHRVVHGGELFKQPVLINEEVIDGIKDTISFAPLHNPANLAGILTARKLCPDIPQVAVFDTGYFQSLPYRAFRYAIPKSVSDKNIRRYGFHGISHQYVSRKAAEHLNQSLDTLKLITLHLGNGASAAAILNGRCIDTSMGMTPLEGLIMGTRCGDIDPSLPFYIMKQFNKKPEELEEILNNESGLKALCGEEDMRKIHKMAESGDKPANQALELYSYKIRKYIGAYFAALDGLDALIFTAGVGENDPVIRKKICSGLSALGVEIDQQRNESVSFENPGGNSVTISTKESQVKVLVIPANEELEIARQSTELINGN